MSLDLESLLTLAASSLLGKSVYIEHGIGGRIVFSPGREEIEEAVRAAHKIWKETLRQQREG